MRDLQDLSSVVPEFKPFYNQDSTERLLNTYYQAPHLINDDLLSQIKDHAAHYNIPFEEERVPKDLGKQEFNLLRGIRQMGEGFFSGFTTFNVGEPSKNPYERIMRSVGELGGFVGYFPTAPLKALTAAKVLKSTALLDAARALRGNSVPLFLSRKATEKVAPLVSNTLKKAAPNIKNEAVQGAVKFMTDDKPSHIAEGAFNLGLASSISAWQLGVNEMLKAGLHGGVTGGVFRGVAEIFNKGGIPKTDILTGKQVLTASQKEDKILRAASSSLYDGLQSSYRGDTTPEQIYHYLLGAYFGANETTAGQAKYMKHVQKVEKKAASNAKALKRVDEDGKPYNWDTEIYDPELADPEGWKDLTKTEQEAVYDYILANHGTYGKQAMMTHRLMQEAGLEPNAEQLKLMGSNSKERYELDVAMNRVNKKFETQKTADRAESIGRKFKVLPEAELTEDYIKNEGDRGYKKGKQQLVIQERSLVNIRTSKDRGPTNEDAAIPLKGAEIEKYNQSVNLDFPLFENELGTSVKYDAKSKKVIDDGTQAKAEFPLEFADKDINVEYKGKDNKVIKRDFKDWSPELYKIKEQVEEATGYNFDLARVDILDKDDYTKWEQENDPIFQRTDKRGPVQATVLIGEGRPLNLRHKDGNRNQIELNPGDIFLSKGVTNDNIKLKFDKSKKAGRTYRITFKRVKAKETPRALGEGQVLSDNILKLYTKGMSDDFLNFNKKAINTAFKVMEEKFPDSTVVAPENLGLHLKDTAPETYAYLMQKIQKLRAPVEKARQQLVQEDILDADFDKPDLDNDIGVMGEAVIQRKTNKFVSDYLSGQYEGIVDKNKRSVKIQKLRSQLKDVLKENFKEFDINNSNKIDSDKFIEDVEKKLDGIKFGEEARGDLRQLLMRQNQTKPLQKLSLNIDAKPSGIVKSGDTIIIGIKNPDGIYSKRNKAGVDEFQLESPKQIDHIWKEIAPQGEANDNVYMVADKVIFVTKKGGREIELQDINKRTNYTGSARWDDAAAAKEGSKIKSMLLEEAHNRGYYFNGGKGDSGKMYFFKYHPSSQGLTAPQLKTKVDGVLIEYYEGLKQRHIDSGSEKPYMSFKQFQDQYNAMKKEFVAEHQLNPALKFSTGRIKEAEKYFDEGFLSNIAWEAELYGVSATNEGFARWTGYNSSIKDAKGFNKRNQIWMTDGFEVDKNFYVNTVSNIMKNKGHDNARTIADGKLRFRLIRDADPKDIVLTDKDKAEIYTESTDGMILLEENHMDALNLSMGMPSSGQNKSFIVDRDPTYGAFLGKFMFHKASPEASKHMRDKGVEMYVFDSAAKEKGSRDFGELKIDDNLNAKYNGQDYYELNIDAIKGSLSEKQSSHMLDAQLIPKQVMANLVPHAQSEIDRAVMDDFFNETIGKKYKGNEQYNESFKKALEKDVVSETEQAEFLSNFNDLGVMEVIDAIKNPNHPEFVTKLYQKILDKNMSDLGLEYESGQVDRYTYEQAHAEAANIRTGIDRMMDVYPSVEIFLYKDVRNFIQTAMKNFVVNKVIRPKWDYSVSVRMRGLDPWLAKQDNLKDLNIGKGLIEDPITGKKVQSKTYLRNKYGVENADELFFLDDRYKQTTWDISEFITLKKGQKSKMTLEEIWKQYGPRRDGTYPSERMKEFFKTISIRVPMDSISGAHKLTFAGFTGVDGHGGIFHPRTMRALGGADLDGDKAFAFFGMKPEWKEMYHSNKMEFAKKVPGTNDFTIRDNKTAGVPKIGLDILKETFAADPSKAADMFIMDKLEGKNAEELTLQDLLTFTTAGDKDVMALKASPLGKYTVSSRMDISQRAAEGRAHLGPAVSSKQILNAMYNALTNNDVQRYVNKKSNSDSISAEEFVKLSKKEQQKYKEDYSEELTFIPEGHQEPVQIRITPREDLTYARELQRAQIAFGSDPLDELGLSGIDRYFDLSWHSMFKTEIVGADPKTVDPNILRSFEPHKHAKQGLYKIFKDFNSAYFSKNWVDGRRWHATEIAEMSRAITKLNSNQMDTMLPQMVKILKDIDFSDDISSRISLNKLNASYDYHQKEVVPRLQELNNRLLDVDGNKISGGVLGRGYLDAKGVDWSKGKGFASPKNPIIDVMLSKKLFDVNERLKYILPEHNGAVNFEKLFKDNFKKTKDFYWQANPSFYKSEILKNGGVEKYNEYRRFEQDFRREQVEQLYRDATEFMQYNAMDRNSALRTMEALEEYYNAGGSAEFAERISKEVEYIKQVDMESKVRSIKEEVLNSDEYKSLSEKEQRKVYNTLEVKEKISGLSDKDEINLLVRKFKYANSWKAKFEPNMQDPENPGMMTLAESKLFDTLMLSSYYRGPGNQQLVQWQKLPANMKKLLSPYIKTLKYENSGTYFHKTGLSSAYITNASIKNFLEGYANEFRKVYTDPSESIEVDFKKVLTTKEKETKDGVEVPKLLYEEDYVGMGTLREKAVAKLNKDEIQLVDELAGHIQHYRDSFNEGGLTLNKIARKVVRKNVDAMTIDDYRVLNGYFRQMRSGNMFISPGKLTAEGAVRLSERHHMLFPRMVSDEQIVKDFKLFEERGLFQNYNGEWVEGMTGRPSHFIEHTQYAIGTIQDYATKLKEDEIKAFNERVSELTGYDTIENGDAFIEVATALKDYNYVRDPKTAFRSENDRSVATEVAVKNLKEAYEKADWENVKDTKIKVTVKAESGPKGQEMGGIIERTGKEIVASIDKVLTERSIEVMKWIKGDHWEYINGQWVEGNNPLKKLFKRDKKGNIMHHGDSAEVPIIDMQKFSRLMFDHMKAGKQMDMKLGMDNMRYINRNLRIEILKEEAQRPEFTEKQKNGIWKIIKNLSDRPIESTGVIDHKNYHPHMVENKTFARESLVKQLNKLIEKRDRGEVDADIFDKEAASLIHRHKTLTGEWYIDDIVDNQLFETTLQKINEKKMDAPEIKQMLSSPTTGNMMSRTSMLAGFKRDLGAWDVYQANLIDAYFRQMGQAVSTHMLGQFKTHLKKIHKTEPEQVTAWGNWMQDYISRSLGSPSKIPEAWMDPNSPMKVRGTPYSWFADNHVADLLNKVKKNMGFKGDERLPEELRGINEWDLRHWSNLEAKYQLATLLAHPKSAVANIFGGTLHTIQSVGWKNWKNAKNITWLKKAIGGDKVPTWETMKDAEKWTIGHGVVPDFILNEAQTNPIFKKGKYKAFLEDALKKIQKDPSVKDETLLDIAKRHNITKSMFDKAAWFMREPERILRRDSFIAHYLQARELYGHANMELNHPMLIHMAKKGVQATQFLYSAPFRPAFSNTSLGKVMTRFQTWAWNSVRFRNDVYRAAKIYGFRQGTPAFARYKRQVLTDMFVFGLANVFAYSLFESAMPQPYGWFQDTADWVFGNERERDRAFFGQWPTAVAPLQMVTPPSLRLVPATFNAVLNNDFSRISDYQLWTMFPFGRLARDTKGIIENPMRTVEKTTGIPYMQFAREATKYREKDED